jgi:hypothetical protein
MRWLAATILCVALAGCGVRPPGAGIEPGSKAVYGRVGVLALMTDNLAMQWTDGWTSTNSAANGLGWQPPERTVRIAAELLGPLGSQAHALAAPPHVAEDAGAADWARRIWQDLHDAGRLDDVDGVLLLRQNAINALGRQYAPAMDFLAMGLVGVAVGAVTREQNFQERFLLLRQEGIGVTLDGSTGRCSIGFDARLLDAKTGEVRGTSDSVLGAEKIPEGTIQAQTWPAMSEAERRAAETYCMAALRRGVSQAIKEVDLTQPR